MKLTFFGAVDNVTGSKHILEVAGRRILLDCGMYQGRRAEANRRNRELPFNPSGIHSTILSHSHIDHSGCLPTLVRDGFTGSIFCTPATRDLAKVMLMDSAHIQERDAEYLNRRLAKRGEPLIEPIYTKADAENCFGQFQGVSYGERFTVAEGVTATLHDAGHILGSAQVLIEAQENGRTKKIAFTGDLGRRNIPILKDPVQLTGIDALITESTYGYRAHEPVEGMKERLGDILRATFAGGGRVVVPAFSVGRTQTLVYFLHMLLDEKRIPPVSIFIDSPLSTRATEVFANHAECFDKETMAFYQRGESPFVFEGVHYVTELSQSKRINVLKEPCVVLSASGMCEAGRILHHLANAIGSAKNTVLIVGFMAEHTLGRRLLEGRKELKFLGEKHRLRARVEKLNAFSAHADKNELLDNAAGAGDTLKDIFIVHGEPDQAKPLADALSDNGAANVVRPVEGRQYEL